MYFYTQSGILRWEFVVTGIFEFVQQSYLNFFDEIYASNRAYVHEFMSYLSFLPSSTTFKFET